MTLEDDDQAIAGLNLYAQRPHAFDEQSLVTGLLVATTGAIALMGAREREQVTNLRSALEHSREIGIAIGILMWQHRITRDQAFNLLRISSQHTHRKLRDVAADVAESGTLDLPQDWRSRPELNLALERCMGSESGVRICVIGVGRMGLPLCASFGRGGHSVTAFDARPRVAAAVRGAGARWAASLADAVSGAEIVVSMLPTVESTIEVAGAAMPLMTAGTLWIDMGSNTPATSAALLGSAEAHRIDVLDSPVGGGPSAALSGTLQLFVGGSRAVFERHRHVLESVADPDRMHYLGTHGCGYVAKLLVNLLWFGQAIAMTEALLLAQESGVDLSSMYSALQRSAVAGRFVDVDLRALLGGNYLTTFGLAGCHDELAAVCDLAGETETPFAVSRVITDIYQQALESFGAVDGELMGAAFLETKAGRTLRADTTQRA